MILLGEEMDELTFLAILYCRPALSLYKLPMHDLFDKASILLLL